MIEDFEADVTPRLLSSLADTLKGCRFTLETGPSHRLLDLLDTRALDVVVATDLPADPAPIPPAARCTRSCAIPSSPSPLAGAASLTCR